MVGQCASILPAQAVRENTLKDMPILPIGHTNNSGMLRKSNPKTSSHLLFLPELPLTTLQLTTNHYAISALLIQSSPNSHLTFSHSSSPTMTDAAHFTLKQFSKHVHNPTLIVSKILAKCKLIHLPLPKTKV